MSDTPNNGGQPPFPGSDPAGPAGAPYQGGYQTPPHQGSRSKTPWIVAGVLAVLLIAGAAIAIPMALGGDDEPTADSAFEVILAPGEVILAPANEPGPDPFSPASFASGAPDPILAQPLIGEDVEIETTGTSQLKSNDATEPGLYGGTLDSASCNVDQMIAFLETNPEKAAAWVQAQNADPDLNWTGGTLTTANLSQYLSELTPLVLRQDTRVTNHGYQDGLFNKRPTVLQKGTAVLVDQYGVPRAQCYCGNPLIPAEPLDQAPKYVGKQWQDFDPDNIYVVNQSTTIINEFVVTDPATGQLVTIPAGSTPPAATPTTGAAPTTTVAASTTTVAADTTTTPAPTTTAPATTTATTTTTTTTTPPTTAPQRPPLPTDYVEATSGKFRFEIPAEFAGTPYTAGDNVVAFGFPLEVGLYTTTEQQQTDAVVQRNAQCDSVIVGTFSALLDGLGPVDGTTVEAGGNCSPVGLYYIFTTPMGVIEIYGESRAAVEKILDTIEVYP